MTKLKEAITGEWVRQEREAAGLSQAKLAEVSGLPQHNLSAFELGHRDLASHDQALLIDALRNVDKISTVVARKKRYQPHSFGGVKKDAARAAWCPASKRTADYLQSLSTLGRVPRPDLRGVSLFSGVGGLSLGFRSAGVDIKGFVELDAGLSRIYRANFPSAHQIGSDIQSVSDEAISAFRDEAGEIDLLIGGPPCQGFSLAGKRKVDDPRNELFRDYMRFVDGLKPKVAIIENVRLLTSMKAKSGSLVKDEIATDFRRRGYKVGTYEINAKNFGVPQHRERVIFLAVHQSVNREPTLPDPTHGEIDELFCETKPVLTFGDACSDLPFIEAGEESSVEYHVAVKHPDHVVRWLWDVPQGMSAHDNEDPNLRPPSGYNTTYKRQVWNEPGATVQTTFGMISGCRNVHPVATRSLTVREAARLQSFPDDYVFEGSLGTVRTGIGNAVPPILAQKVASHLRTAIFDLVEISSL